MVLVLKRLRRRGNGLKSHPTDWEKPEIEPGTPGLQGIALIHYTTGAQEQRANDNILMVTSLYIPLAHLKFHLKGGVRLDMH